VIQALFWNGGRITRRRYELTDKEWLIMVLSDKGETLSHRCDSGKVCSGSIHEQPPLGQGDRPSLFVNLAIDEMALQGKVIVKVGLDGCEFL
jgi:hypothetical protein